MFLSGPFIQGAYRIDAEIGNKQNTNKWGHFDQGENNEENKVLGLTA